MNRLQEEQKKRIRYMYTHMFRRYRTNTLADVGGSISDKPVLGAELIPDASRWFNIDNDPYWNKDSGVTISGGTCNFNSPNNGAALYKNFLQAGKKYKVTVNVLSINGQLNFYNGYEVVPVTTTGTKEMILLQTSGAFIIRQLFTTTATIDNISVREVLIDSVTTDYLKMAQNNRMDKSIRFGWLGEAGSKIESGKVSKAYSFDFNNYQNNATQTTPGSRPYLTGNIAPNEKLGLKNPNGGSNYMTHPTISFAANESWSWSGIVNWNGQGDTSNPLNIVGGSSKIRLRSSGTDFLYIGATQSTFSTRKLLGKKGILQVTYNNGTITIYHNGAFYETLTGSAAFDFTGLFYGTTGAGYYGVLQASIIRSQALTPTQVTAEYNYLRSVYPEIESVVIGTQTWATSNCAVAASSNGTVIPDGTLTANWTAGTSYWCHHTNIDNGAIYDKLYNKAAKLVLAANPPEGWHYATQAELTTIAALGGNALKVIGTGQWLTANGTNSTGISLLGSSKRNADGSFSTIKSECYIWAADTDFVLKVTDAGVATIEAANANDGYALRLVKN